MNAITLRNIPSPLQDALERRAQEAGLSVDRTVLSLLEEALGLGKQEPSRPVYHDLDHLMGTWSQEEAEAFDTALAEQRQVETELWD